MKQVSEDREVPIGEPNPAPVLLIIVVDDYNQTNKWSEEKARKNWNQVETRLLVPVAEKGVLICGYIKYLGGLGDMRSHHRLPHIRSSSESRTPSASRQKHVLSIGASPYLSQSAPPSRSVGRMFLEMLALII